MKAGSSPPTSLELALSFTLSGLFCLKPDTEQGVWQKHSLGGGTEKDLWPGGWDPTCGACPLGSYAVVGGRVLGSRRLAVFIHFVFIHKYFECWGHRSEAKSLPSWSWQPSKRNANYSQKQTHNAVYSCQV